MSLISKNQLIVRLSATFLLVLISLSSCKKYDEGPAFSLRSKAKRLEGLWKASRQVENGIEFLNEHTIEFKLSGSSEDQEKTFGTYTLYTWNGSNDIEEYYGTWEFSSDKEYLYMQYTRVNYNYGQGWGTIPFSFTIQSKILRLTNKELWLEEKRGDRYHLHLEFEKQ